MVQTRGAILRAVASNDATAVCSEAGGRAVAPSSVAAAAEPAASEATPKAAKQNQQTSTEQTATANASFAAEEEAPSPTRTPISEYEQLMFVDLDDLDDDGSAAGTHPRLRTLRSLATACPVESTFANAMLPTKIAADKTSEDYFL